MVVDSTSSHFHDELYYSANEYAEEDAKDKAAYQAFLQENNVEEEVLHDEELYEEEFDYDDCYDYYYTSRLRRFHGPHFGFSYYNNYFTNSFWYSNNPYNCGVSIYYGYNFWNPWHLDPWHNYNFGWGYHFPHNHWPYHNYWSYWMGIIMVIMAIIQPILILMIIIVCIMVFVKTIITEHLKHLQIVIFNRLKKDHKGLIL